MVGVAPLALALVTWAGADDVASTPRAAEPRRFALRAAKALTSADEGNGFVDHAVVLVEDGRIHAIGPSRTTPIPAGWEVLDVGSAWVMPGMVDLHSHVGGSGDINDAVLQVNGGLRVNVAVIPDNPRLRLATAAGVTTVLFIPGSATNVGGQGILLKTGLDTYEAMRIRDPGSLKIAQGDNPKRWCYGMQRSMMNWTIRAALRRGLAYARAWAAAERGEADAPERRLELDIFRELYAKTTQISTHTQYYQVVLQSLKILREEFGYDVYIDHGSFDSWKLAPVAEELGVAAILGPREVLASRPPRYDTDGRIVSTAAGFQELGHSTIGFNTDAPVVPQEELPLQAAMSVRYGFDDTRMDAVRGVTIVPAQVAGIGDRVGSLEPGKDADLVVVTGDPLDPRHSVAMVFIEGRLVYDREEQGMRW